MEVPGPFARGTLLPSLGLGGSFSSSFSVLRFGAGLTYFFLYGLGLGLNVDDTLTFYGKSVRTDFPGIEKQTPTNIALITPSVTWVFVRRPRFSPFVSAGVGPVFFNNGGGVHGRWVASGGAFVGLGERAFLSVGVSFSSMFPARACRDAFNYTDPSGNTDRIFRTTPCSFTWGPTLGLGVSFGGRRPRPPPPGRSPTPAAPRPVPPQPPPSPPPAQVVPAEAPPSAPRSEAAPEPEPEPEPSGEPSTPASPAAPREREPHEEPAAPPEPGTEPPTQPPTRPEPEPPTGPEPGTEPPPEPTVEPSPEPIPRAAEPGTRAEPSPTADVPALRAGAR